MEITQEQSEGALTLHLNGRFDAHWADHVGNAIEAAVRNGQHRIVLGFSQVDYLSSAGIRILMNHYKQLKAANGSLRLVHCTGGVLAVLQLAGIAEFLVVEPDPPGTPASQSGSRRWEKDGLAFELFDQHPGSVLECRRYGHPDRFSTGRLSAADSTRVRLDPDVLSLGLGGFGNERPENNAQFGEFLAVAGAGIVLPADGSSLPDFQISQDRFVPEGNLLYGLSARGKLAHLLRFEASRATQGVLGLGHLVETVLGQLETPSAAMVILAESACVIGASLRQSPVTAGGTSPWSFPGVRDWVSFTTERTDERNVALIVGVVEREPSPSNAPFLRRIGPGTMAQGHFHAAVFPYRPLPKGSLSLQETATGLLHTESAQTVLHLLADERAFEGVGQTDLLRGACWFGPLRMADAPSNS